MKYAQNELRQRSEIILLKWNSILTLHCPCLVIVYLDMNGPNN
jgi:hypothetical protein